MRFDKCSNLFALNDMDQAVAEDVEQHLPGFTTSGGPIDQKTTERRGMS